MTFLKKSISAIGIFAGLNCIGQPVKPDTTIHMKEAVIVSNRLQLFTPGNKIQTIDSFALKNNATNSLSDIISSQTQVQMNSYGAGALSTPSFRGTGSSHTAVLWNGFNMQDVLNGLVDFSLIPGFFLDNVRIQSGGCGALYGSGAIGGAIDLNNHLLFDEGVKASIIGSYGSYANQFIGTLLKLSESKFSGSIRVFDHSIKNNFQFNNIYQPEFPRQELLNAETKQQGALIDNTILINEKQELNFHLWFQNSDHNIPSLMNDTLKSQQNEKNQFVRRTLDWKKTGKKSLFIIRVGAFNNDKYFEDPSYNIKVDYHSVSSIYEFENNFRINKNLKINSGLNYTHEKGSSPSLDKTHIRDRSAIFASLKYNLNNKSIQAVVSIRDEFVNNSNTPPTYSMGLDGELCKGLHIKGNINKSYRIPSFNDLYWNDMVWNMFGNPDLKNEEGINEEMSLNYSRVFSKVNFEASTTVFNSNVTNWILWEPIDNYSKWTPMNVDTVWSRGIELNADIAYTLNNFMLEFSGMYTYLKTTDESKSADSAVKQKQLIYVPKQKLVANMRIGYKKFLCQITESLVSDRFTNAENTDKVNGYSLSDIVISKEMAYKDYVFNLDFHLNNMFNKSYEVMQYYPMPFRNYQVGLRIDFNKANK